MQGVLYTVALHTKQELPLLDLQTEVEKDTKKDEYKKQEQKETQKAVGRAESVQ